ncbi:MAG TPA: hypothetical protein VF861_14520 [Telluria sp.]
MTVKHMIEGIMHATKARNQRHCAIKLAMTEANISRILSGKFTGHGMLLASFDIIQQKSGIPADTLLGWYRQPEQ